MAWQKIGMVILRAYLYVLAYLIFLIIAVLVTPLLLVRLPLLCCQLMRSVRFLPYAVTAYFGLVVPSVLLALGLTWWKAALFAGSSMLLSGCLLPNAFAYFVNPRKRKAVVAAISFLETQSIHWIDYTGVTVVASEPERLIVCVTWGTTRPPTHSYHAVSDDGRTVEELNLEYVASKHGVRPPRYFL